MAKYIVIKDFTSPVAFSGSSHPKFGVQVRQMRFKKGKVIDGELKTKSDGSPDYILHKKCVVVPLTAVRQLVTKAVLDSSSSAEGGENTEVKEKKVITESNNKIKFIDNAIIGAIVGLAVTYFAQKKGWIPEENPESKIPHQNKLTGIALGAAAGIYWTYKKNVKSGIKIIKDKNQIK